jgi:poly-gamma-glutamate synthesis protein (capsule biosynthesis protein)
MQWLAGCGLISVLALTAAAFHNSDLYSASSMRGEYVASLPAPIPRTLRLLAVGDVNLGRGVGQEILDGDTLYPFVAVKDSFQAYDVVFANLESQLSDQAGETQSPRNNLIFTGPPAGSFSLRKAGVTVVSTANNHALDYGVKGLRETITHLDAAGVEHVGTSDDTVHLYAPVILLRNGIRIAFLACTDVMNIEDQMWKRYVAEADTAKLLPRIRSLRDSIDFIIVSYHGGEEYADRPTLRTKEFARQLISGGADLFLGHHPHVPYGVEQFEGKYIVHSLGNFVFRQPDRYWTQRSFAFAADLSKDSTGTRVRSLRCLAVKTGFQPEFAMEKNETDLIHERIRALSTQSLAYQVTR